MEELNRPKVDTLFALPFKGGQQLEPVRAELYNDRLLVCRHDLVYEDVLAHNDIVNERVVTLVRGEDGIGVSIQGGLDFKCPVKVYKVYENSPAAVCGQVQERDIILSVNDISMWGKTHDEAVDLIQNAGKNVKLHLATLRLKEPGEEAHAEDQLLPLADIPLTLASVTKYQKGTSILRPNAFQVISQDGHSKVTLHCDDHTPNHLNDWVTAINDRIKETILSEIERWNTLRDQSETVIWMGWVYEHLPSTTHTRVWQRKFLVLKKQHLQLFSVAPENAADWVRPENSYKLLEMTVKVLKAHEFPEQRANTIVLTSGTGTNHILSFETHPNLALWTGMIHQTTIAAVVHMEKQQFHGQWKSQDIIFLLDINEGVLICSRSDLSTVLWRNPFSFLRHSSDDGHKTLRLECAVQGSGLTEVQEIQLEDLQIAVCAIECFLTTKVASIDPDFIVQTDLVSQ